MDALCKWYNIAEPISTGLFDSAVNFSGKPGAPSFDMVDIWLHHNATVPAIEGDASFRYVESKRTDMSLAHHDVAVPITSGGITTHSIELFGSKLDLSGRVRLSMCRNLEMLPMHATPLPKQQTQHSISTTSQLLGWLWLL